MSETFSLVKHTSHVFARPLVAQWKHSSASLQALPSKKETATSKLWLYRSTADFEGDANAGLIGPLIVTDPAHALPSKQPSDVAQTFVALFQAGTHGSCRNYNGQLWLDALYCLKSFCKTNGSRSAPAQLPSP